MEIPLAVMSGFEPEINRLQNYPFVLKLLQIAGIDELSNLWTWVALVLAVFATIVSLINSSKIVSLRSRKQKPTVEFQEEDESVCSSGDQVSLTEEESMASPSEYDTDEYFPVAIREPEGSDSGWDFAKENVVKFWDNIKVKARRSFEFQSQQQEGFGFNFGFNFVGGENLSWVPNGNSNGILSLWDLNRGAIVRAIAAHRSHIPAICLTSPVVVVSGGEADGRGKAAFKVWDARMGRQIPAAVAEWDSGGRRIWEINSGGVEKFLVRNDDRSMAVHDLRMVGDAVPTQSDDTMWWDADAVMVPDGDQSDSEDEFQFVSPETTAAGSSGSVVTWCFNAVRSLSK